MLNFELVKRLKVLINDARNSMEEIEPEYLKQVQGKIEAYKRVINIIQQDHISWKLKEAGFTQEDHSLWNFEAWLWDRQTKFRVYKHQPILDEDKWCDFLDFIDTHIQEVKNESKTK